MGDLKEMQKEIDEMAKALEEPNAGMDDPRTDPSGTIAPGTEAPGTEAPSTNAPSTDAPSTEAPSTEAPAEDPRDAEIRELREKIAGLENPPKSTKPPSTKAPSTDPPIGEEDFLSDVDLDEATRDPSILNAVLNKIYKKARTDARTELKGGIESIIRSIPDITKNTIAIQAQLAKARDDFYKENEDLRPWSKSVSAVMEEMISENPDKRYDELLPKVADEVRKRLNLQKNATKPNDKDNPPPLPKKKGGQRQTTKPDLSNFDREIEAMDKALELD